METYEQIIYEMYGYSFLEFVFLAIDSFIFVICFILLLVGSYKLNKKLNTPKTKFLFLSMLGLLFSSTISGIVSEMGYSDSEFLSLGELLLVYLPTVFFILVTISTLGLIKAIKEV